MHSASALRPWYNQSTICTKEGVATIYAFALEATLSVLSHDTCRVFKTDMFSEAFEVALLLVTCQKCYYYGAIVIAITAEKMKTLMLLTIFDYDIVYHTRLCISFRGHGKYGLSASSSPIFAIKRSPMIM